MTQRINLIAVTPDEFKYNVKVSCCIPMQHMKINRISDRVGCHSGLIHSENYCDICNRFINDRILQKTKSQSNITVRHPTLQPAIDRGFSTLIPLVGNCKYRFERGYFQGWYCNKQTNNSLDYCPECILTTLRQYAEQLVRPSS